MTQPRYVVITTMKNEAPFIVDWVAHQLMLGFEYILIATNDCEDTTDPLIDRIGEITGKVKRHKTIVRSGGIQRSAMRQCAVLYKEAQEAEWLYICDADEFLNIHIDDGSLQALLNAAGKDCSAITVPWRIFRSTRNPDFIDKPIMTQALECEPISGDGVHANITGVYSKTIYRPSPMIHRLGIHLPTIKEEHIDDYKFEYPGGLERISEPIYEYRARLKAFEFAQINHYALRSLDSYLVKINRGRANHGNQILGYDYWKKNNRGGAFDRTILRYQDRFNAVRDELMSDRIVADLHQQGSNWYQRRISEMRAIPEIQMLIEKVQEE